MINFKWLRFSELDCTLLYNLLNLRAEIFIVDQNCVYQDIDNRDQEALHLLGFENNILVTYARLFVPTKTRQTLIFGRVLTAKFARHKGHAKKLLGEILAYCGAYYPKIAVECSAQLYLKDFYEGFGFKAVGEIYFEANIPHIKMIFGG